jgi:hypothetical protein
MRHHHCWQAAWLYVGQHNTFEVRDLQQHIKGRSEARLQTFLIMRHPSLGFGMLWPLPSGNNGGPAAAQPCLAWWRSPVLLMSCIWRHCCCVRSYDCTATVALPSLLAYCTAGVRIKPVLSGCLG